jgi:hypothetical protein
VIVLVVVLVLEKAGVGHLIDRSPCSGIAKPTPGGEPLYHVAVLLAVSRRLPRTSRCVAVRSLDVSTSQHNDTMDKRLRWVIPREPPAAER